MHGPQETACRGLIDHVIPPVQFKHLGCGSWKTGRRDPRLLGSRKGLEREERHGNSVRPQRAASWLGTVPHMRACAHTGTRVYACTYACALYGNRTLLHRLALDLYGVSMSTNGSGHPRPGHVVPPPSPQEASSGQRAAPSTHGPLRPVCF